MAVCVAEVEWEGAGGKNLGVGVRVDVDGVESEGVLGRNRGRRRAPVFLVPLKGNAVICWCFEAGEEQLLRYKINRLGLGLDLHRFSKAWPKGWH